MVQPTEIELTVSASDTASVLVTPVRLLSGIARAGVADQVFTGLPPPPVGLMVSVTFVVCTSEPLVPVIVMACGPVAAPAVVVQVKVAEPLAAMGLGAKP